MLITILKVLLSYMTHNCTKDSKEPKTFSISRPREEEQDPINDVMQDDVFFSFMIIIFQDISNIFQPRSLGEGGSGV